MSKSCGFIVSVGDEVDFYAIKRFIQSLEYARLIYCTIAKPHSLLYIKTSEELEKGGEQDNKN